MLAGLADNERFCYFLITFVTQNSIQNDQFPANIWVPLCCHPLFGDVNQRKGGKRKNLSQTCKHKLAETVFNSIPLLDDQNTPYVLLSVIGVMVETIVIMAAYSLVIVKKYEEK
ncbi:hypothetical protein [[Ruminococcus] lactaris]|uniref:hypothetical protein n=1 Tax=[Ruminococcus] lactaris TaxID=46228 RepID=UPI001F4389C2|nr:hypothetical protein [[Ruminococcus] lactaris]